VLVAMDVMDVQADVEAVVLHIVEMLVLIALNGDLQMLKK
jgi:hypothetical protein